MSQSIMFITQGLGRSMEVIGNALATSIMQIPEIRIFHKIMLLEIHHRHQIMFSIHTVLINSRVLKVFLLAVTII